MGIINDLFLDARALTPDRKQEVTRAAVWIGIISVLIALSVVMATAWHTVGAEHPMWDAVLQARLALVRLVLAVPVLLIGFGVAQLLFNVLETTDLGRRTIVPEDGDNVDIRSFKMSNAGFVLAAIFFACIVGLMVSVLR